uniref:Ty3 transposon capsid-like protein domain-containing protein n=1 Tax=Kryptolebias marmoratus TaxID=37003 RepID=A0A3Q3ATP0_KRYMA
VSLVPMKLCSSSVHQPSACACHPHFVSTLPFTSLRSNQSTPVHCAPLLSPLPPLTLMATLPTRSVGLWTPADPARESAQSSAPIQTTFSDCQLPSPTRYDGDPRRCRGFLMQCNIQFNHSPQKFPHDSAKISYIIAHLSGHALDWAEVKFASIPQYGCTFDEFLTEFKQAFNQETEKSLNSRGLLRLKQGQRSVTDLSIDFRIQAAASGWNDSALKSVYLSGCFCMWVRNVKPIMTVRLSISRATYTVHGPT